MADNNKDDLDAVRAIAAVLQPFEPKERDRVLRWVCEKLEMATPRTLAPAIESHAQLVAPSSLALATPTHRHHGSSDIRTFMENKSPKSDVQFAATVAYYYAFEAPQSERKEEIGSEDLLAACRLVGRKRPPVPRQTILNAHNLGYLDKGSAKGLYRINSVGENLVAMVLPAAGGTQKAAPRKRKKKSAGARGTKKR